MPIKSIKKIIKARKVNMGGNILEQSLPNEEIDAIDPFLLIHHWIDKMPGGEKQQDVGVGPHPHRGFSPITFVYKGNIQHRDSLGNNAIVSEGGTQWMFAGKGITHSERPSKIMAEEGGEIEFIQFWVNTPSKNKMQAPFYKPISKDETPTIKNEKSTIQIVCGDYDGIEGSVKYYSPLSLLRVELAKGAQLQLNLKKHFNTLIYQLDGKLELNSENTKGKNMAWFKNDGELINVVSIEDTRFIVLSGEPIGEQVISYGPFVMNTQSEIMESLRDSQSGKMGVLIEEF